MESTLDVHPLPPAQLALRADCAFLAVHADDVLCLLPYLEEVHYAPSDWVMRQGDKARAMYFVGAGRLRLRRNSMDLGAIGAGEHVGELGLLTGRDRAASVQAEMDSVLWRLDYDHWQQMAATHPQATLRLTEALVGHLGGRLTDMTDRVDLLLKQRSVPRHSSVVVQLEGETRHVRTGLPLRALLPAQVDGWPVVAGLVDFKPVSLLTPLTSNATVAPLSLQHWEGRGIARHSIGLLLLEAAHAVAPELDVRMGQSIGFAQRVEVGVPPPEGLASLAQRLSAAMHALIAADAPFRVEWWTVEEAVSHLRDQGWGDAARLLRVHREAAVAMVSCGHVYAPCHGPMLPSTGTAVRWQFVAGPDGLLLYFDDERRPHLDPPRDNGAPNLGDTRMVHDHARWLSAMGVTSVGTFNELCISGQVAHLIRISEGFQEKRLGMVADAIARRDGVRVICVAGPSSSGKTTFIKRLTVQLQVDGLNPVGLSLDDYYVDREKTVRDAHGEYDFEALEALDLSHLQDHVGRLLRGEKVRTASYDFKQGKSHPEGGPELQLGANDLLIMEGIHGLNPRLLGDAVHGREVYRIFINPMTALPLDRLTRVNVSDLRLLRRIVRDRHQRGHSAAANIERWPSVRRGERSHIFRFLTHADVVFDSSLVYELSVLKVFAERYLLEVPCDHAAFTTAWRLRQLIDELVTIYPDHVPPTSMLREFIGGSGFEA